jgi:RimJ/RimL family protein N-acetyltransferase
MKDLDSVAQPFLGERVRLRPMSPKDVDGLTQILDHPGLAGRRYLPSGLPDLAPLSTSQIEEIQEKWAKTEKALDFLVERKTDPLVIGYAGCSWWWDTHHPSMHVVIDPAQQRKGYGGEVVGLLLNYLFDFTPAHNISCWIAAWNQEALTFASKHGFEQAGKMRRAGLRGGEVYDLVVMNLLRPDWQAAQGAD